MREFTCHVAFGPGWDELMKGSQFHVSLSPIFLGEGPSVHRLLQNWTTQFPVHIFLVFHTDGRFHCSPTLFHIYDRTSYVTFYPLTNLFPLNADRNGMAGKRRYNWLTGWLLAQVVTKLLDFRSSKYFFGFHDDFWIVNYFRVFRKVNCRSNTFFSVCNVCF